MIDYIRIFKNDIINNDINELLLIIIILILKIINIINLILNNI